jgi:hypothetical protein
MKMYRVCWKSRLTGFEGKGEWTEKKIAEAWFKELTGKSAPSEFRNFDHWVEKKGGQEHEIST